MYLNLSDKTLQQSMCLLDRLEKRPYDKIAQGFHRFLLAVSVCNADVQQGQLFIMFLFCPSTYRRFQGLVFFLGKERDGPLEEGGGYMPESFLGIESWRGWSQAVYMDRAGAWSGLDWTCMSSRLSSRIGEVSVWWADRIKRQLLPSHWIPEPASRMSFMSTSTMPEVVKAAQAFNKVLQAAALSMLPQL